MERVHEGERRAERGVGEAAPEAMTSPIAAIDARLCDLVERAELSGNLREAVEYAALGGGKRVRPVLAWWCCEAAGGAGERSLPAGAGVELVHAFSLVHDDLPAMDDDDFRRGKPTVHKSYGEAMAILAGDQLLALAFESCVRSPTDPLLGAALVRELSSATTGMIRGQVFDTLGGLPDRFSDVDRLEAIHRNKTGALIRAACRMGAMCASGGREESGLEAITAYGEAMGLMFQIIDDLLDVEQSTEHAGKRTGKDAEAGKMTFPAVHGIETSRRTVREQLAIAMDAAGEFGRAGEPLRELARFLAVRTR